MNANYVTVSIPLLLVLAGFNHAHGLITFGKTATTPPKAHHQPVTMKRCDSQIDCAPIVTTTCLNNYCLCGDNQHPVNGHCKAELQGPRHICSKTEDCVFGAECATNSTNKYGPAEKICQCLEGYIEVNYHCSDASFADILSGLAIMAALFARMVQ